VKEVGGDRSRVIEIWSLQLPHLNSILGVLDKLFNGYMFSTLYDLEVPECYDVTTYVKQ
jgi:hypothetical protein